MEGRIKARKATPSKKQITAMQLIAQGEKPTHAMEKAGYAPSVARNPKQNLYKADNMITLIDTLQLELNDVGLTSVYLAKKIKQLVEAQKTDKDDYPTQIQGLKMVQEIYDMKKDKQNKPTRKITFEEFINTE